MIVSLLIIATTLLSVSLVLCPHLHCLTGTPTETSVSAVVSSSGCVKCATNKVGKRSCCARGGTWFENCGNAGDAKFDHTWAEGIQACNTVKSALTVMIHHAGVVVYPLNTTQPRNVIQKWAKIYHPGAISNSAIGSKDCVGFAVCICVSFVILYL